MAKQTGSAKTKTTDESIDFLRLESIAGKARRISTPTYAQVIETLAFIFGQKPDDRPKTRAHAMSDSRSFSRKQLIRRELVKRLLSTWGISKGHGEIVKSILEKVENILSIAKSSTICSSEPSERGNAIFFRKVAFPQVILALRHLRATQDEIFWREMHSYLNDITQNEISIDECIAKLKRETRNLLPPYPNLDFRIWLGQLNSKSFPKLKSVEQSLSGLHDQIGDIERDDIKTGSLFATIKCKFLAAKATISALKFIQDNPDGRPQKIEGASLAAHVFLSRHICKTNNSEHRHILDDIFDDRILDIQYLTENFLNTVNNQDIEDIPDEIHKTPDSLLSYKNGTLFPHALYKNLIDCFRNKNISEEDISRLEKIFLSTKDNHQYGSLGFTIATLLLGQKVKTSRAIPPQSLEPLTMEARKYSAAPLKPFPLFLTPFGTAPATLENIPEYRVVTLIGQFNREMIERGYKHHLCNPFEKLDDILKFYLSKAKKDGTRPKHVSHPSRLPKRPSKLSDMDIYDTVKNINEIFFTHELADDVMFDKRGAMYTQKSRVGRHINEYLALSDAEKREILEMICSEKYQADIEKIDQQKQAEIAQPRRRTDGGASDRPSVRGK